MSDMSDSEQDQNREPEPQQPDPEPESEESDSEQQSDDQSGGVIEWETREGQGSHDTKDPKDLDSR